MLSKASRVWVCPTHALAVCLAMVFSINDPLSGLAAAPAKSSVTNTSRPQSMGSQQASSNTSGGAPKGKGKWKPLEYWLQRRSATTLTKQQIEATRDADLAYAKCLVQPNRKLLEEIARVLNENVPKNPKPEMVRGAVILPPMHVDIGNLRSAMTTASTTEILPYMPIPLAIGRGAKPYTSTEETKIRAAFRTYEEQIRSDRQKLIEALANSTKLPQTEVVGAVQDYYAQSVKPQAPASGKTAGKRTP